MTAELLANCILLVLLTWVAATGMALAWMIGRQ
jgi:hypothetical protein